MNKERLREIQEELENCEAALKLNVIGYDAKMAVAKRMEELKKERDAGIENSKYGIVE